MSKSALKKYLEDTDSFSRHNVNEALDRLESLLQDRDSSVADLDTSNRIYKWLAKLIIPKDIHISTSELDDQDTVKTAPGLKSFQGHALRGLKVLRLLDSTAPIADSDVFSEVLIGLASLSNPNDFWNTDAAADIADSLLSSKSASSNSQEIVVDQILRNFIKPLFAKSRNAAVTAQGRRALRPLPPQYASIHSQIEQKPWKYEIFYTCTVYKWALESLNSKEIKEHWPLVIPPLLTIVDDESTFFKARGCELLRILLAKTEPELLLRTGLGAVITDAIKPCLLYLPALTPPSESFRLLQQAYPTLLQLSDILYPEDSPKRQKMLFLDDILVNGVLKGLDHITNEQGGLDDLAVTRLLLEQISIIVEMMGTWSVRHLQSSIPFLIGLLCTPFSNADLLYAQILLRSVQSLILNGWPQISDFQTIVLEGVISIWMRLEDENLENQQVLTPILRNIISILRESNPPSQDWSVEVGPLVRLHPTLRDLLVQN